MAYRQAAWALALGLIAAACGSDDEAGSGTTDANRAQAFFAAWKRAYCEGVTACCLAGGKASSAETCASWYSDAEFMKAVEKGLTFDAAAAEQCLAEIETWYDGCAKWGEGPPVCNRVLVGTVEVGGSCEVDQDCIAPENGRATCMIVATDTYRCEIRRVVGEGEHCFSLDDSGTVWDDCDWGLDCQDDVCVRQGRLGEDCGAHGCMENTMCDAATNTCVPLPQVGAACENDSFSEGLCDAAAYCDGAACQPKKADGEPCKSHSECLSLCSNGATCSPSGMLFSSIPYGYECISN